MKTKSTAGHQLATGSEREERLEKAKKTLALAKVQETQKKGKYVWNKEQRAFFLTS